MDRYELEERLVEFSVLIIEIVSEMPNSKAGNHTDCESKLPTYFISIRISVLILHRHYTNNFVF